MNRPPDSVVELPIEFALPAAGELPTFTVWSQLPFDGDRLSRDLFAAFDVQPNLVLGNHRRIVAIMHGDFAPTDGRGPAGEGVRAVHGQRSARFSRNTSVLDCVKSK